MLPRIRLVTALPLFALVAMLLAWFRGTWLFASFDIYLTAWHECMHAAAAWLTGGSVSSMTVSAGEGATWTAGGVFPIISAAGYIGTALWGAFLLVVYDRPLLARVGMVVSLSLPAILMIFGGGVGLAWFVVVIFGLASGAAWVHFPRAGNVLVSALFAGESWKDVQVYLFSVPHETDAGILANYFGWSGFTLPIALFFALLSAAIWFHVLRYAITRATKDGNDPSLSTRGAA